jgi:hypothetical protein
MPRSVISYDKDLPEIPGRRRWEKPSSFLVKDTAALTGWREDTSGRRPSKLLLVPKIRAWCERISEATGTVWRYVRVDQADFVARKPVTVAALTITRL